MSANFKLGSWLVQPAAGLISCADSEIKLGPKVMAVLELLATANGTVVTREEIIDCVWPDQIIGDDSLTTCVSSLRRHLASNNDKIQYVQTLPKCGYRLLVAVEACNETETGRQEIRHAPLTISTLFGHKWVVALVVILGISAAFLWQTTSGRDAPLADEGSIAVLPFDVYSDHADAQHFADGLAEELIHQLTADPSRRVIARTSSFKFRNQDRTISEIAATLNVRHIIEGSVRDSDQGMRITVQLIDASSGFHLWSKVFDVGRDNLFDVQKDVGIAVASLIPSANDQRDKPIPVRRSVPDDAYRLYLLGKSHMRVGTTDAYAKAVVLFSDALRIAPDYALANSQLASAYLLLYQYRHDPLEDATRRARAAIDRALKIDPDQPEAFAVLGLLYTYRKDYVAAEKAFTRAIELRPKFGFARHNFGFMLWSQARFEEALIHLRVALDSDPLSGVTNFLVGDSLAGLGRFDEAKAIYKRCREALPEAYGCYAGPATIDMLLGNYDAAAKLLDQAGKFVKPDFFYQDVVLASLAIRRGDYDSAGMLVERASKKSPVDYSLLKSRVVIAMHANQLPRLKRQLDALDIEHPDDRDLKLITALVSYYLSDCKSALTIYEKMLLGDDAFLFDYWDLDTGLSHLENLAFCYKKLNRKDRFADLMTSLERHLSHPQKLDFPGGLFFQAKAYRIKEQPQRSQVFLERLKNTGWPLLWLSQQDPAFR